MATIRDYEQMLKSALEMKEMAQKFIDFAKMQGAGKGEEEMEEIDELETPEDDNNVSSEDDEEASPKSGRAAAVVSALRKKMGK